MTSRIDRIRAAGAATPGFTNLTISAAIRHLTSLPASLPPHPRRAPAPPPPLPAAAEPSSSPPASLSPPVPPSPSQDSRLLVDLLNGAISLGQILGTYKLTLEQLEAWLDSPRIDEALAR